LNPVSGVGSFPDTWCRDEDKVRDKKAKGQRRKGTSYNLGENWVRPLGKKKKGYLTVVWDGHRKKYEHDPAYYTIAGQGGKKGKRFFISQERKRRREGSIDGGETSGGKKDLPGRRPCGKKRFNSSAGEVRGTRRRYAK